MTAPLRLEPLEPRDVPVTFGTPWPDGRHLTLSFAPDGTSILGAASDLDTALFAHEPGARLAVLRAFQAWVVRANVNVGLVPDSGVAFGTAGAMQGDLRVGGRTLAPDVLAVTAPGGGTDPYSGEIVLNTAAVFGAGGFDLFTAALQEAGHALGAGNSPDPSSAMYEYYGGPRVGPSAADADAIRALYGARAVDPFEGATGNDTIATATPLTGRGAADLTTAADEDVYAFTAEPLTGRVTVRLRAAGLSLVTARVEVLDTEGRAIAAAAAADPTRNDVTVSFDPVPAGATYFIRVRAARADEFAVGSYELEVVRSSETESGGGDALVTGHARVRAAVGAGVSATPVPELTAGSLDADHRSESFALAQSGQVRFVLTATGAAEAVVTASSGLEVGRFATGAGRERSLDLFLSAGEYRVTIRALGGAHLDFRLGVLVVTDPIGVRPVNPTSAPDPTVPLSGAPVPVAPTAPPSGAPITSAGPTSMAIPAPAPAPAPAPGGGTAQQMPPGASSQPGGFFVPPIRSRTDPVDAVWYVWWY